MTVSICLEVADAHSRVHVRDRKAGADVWNGVFGPRDRPHATLRLDVDENGTEFGIIAVLDEKGAIIAGLADTVVTDGDLVSISNKGASATIVTGGCVQKPKSRAGKARKT